MCKLVLRASRLRPGASGAQAHAWIEQLLASAAAAARAIGG
jgi:hypothetical protein